LLSIVLTTQAIFFKFQTRQAGKKYRLLEEICGSNRAKWRGERA
jgi:hypothetical protein